MSGIHQLSYPVKTLPHKKRKVREHRTLYSPLEDLGYPFHSLYRPCLPLSYRFAKRGVDICGALIGLVLLAILSFWIALFIFCEDRGPIFYTQVRVGRYGRPFSVRKFRSMVEGADDHFALHPQLLETWQRNGKLRNDPRVTRTGRFLRRTSLDELPQMLNVLRGEMSLVGPRPVQYSEIPAFGDLGELRQTMKPGLTGLWQISGRSMTTYEQRCALDCMYIMECSLKVDLYILCKTFPALMRGLGAY